MATTAAAPPAIASMRLGELLFDALEEPRDQHFGEPRIGEARLTRPTARRSACARRSGISAPVRRCARGRARLHRSALRRIAPRAAPINSPGVGHCLEKGRLQQRVEHARAPGDRFGELGRRAHDRGDEFEQARLRDQQREELHAGRQFRDELVESRERRVGVLRSRRGLRAAPASARSAARAATVERVAG